MADMLPPVFAELRLNATSFFNEIAKIKSGLTEAQSATTSKLSIIGQAWENQASKIAQSSGAMGSAIRAASALGLSSTTLMAAGIATASAVATGALVKFASAGVTSFEDLALQVREFAQVSGATYTQSSLLVGLFNTLGISTTVAERAMFRLSKVAEETPDKLTKIGVTIAKTNSGAVDLNQTFLNTIERLRSLGPGAQANAAAYEIFSRAGLNLNQILAATPAQIKAIEDEVRKRGDIITPAQAQQAIDFKIKTQELSQALSAMGRAIGSDLVPMLTTVAGVADNVATFFDRNKQIMYGLAGAISGPLVGALTVLAGKMAMTIGSAIIGNIQTMIKGFYGLVPAIEAATVAEEGMATATIFATGGLAVLGGLVGIAAMHFVAHKSAADDAAQATSAFGEAEAGASSTVSQYSKDLKEQKDLYELLSGSSHGMTTEIDKLMSDTGALDAATEKLNSDIHDQSNESKAAAERDKEIASAKRGVTSASMAATKALEQETKAKKTLDDLMKPVGGESLAKNQNDLRRADLDHQKALEKVTEAEKALAVARASHKPEDILKATQDLTSAQIDAQDAEFGLLDAQDKLNNTNLAAVGTTQQIDDATTAYKDAQERTTAANQAAKDAQDKLTAAMSNTSVIEARKKDAKELEADTLAWHKAQDTLNTDLGVLNAVLEAHPELRNQLKDQVIAIRDHLPKGADTKPFNDFIDKINSLIPTNASILTDLLMAQATSVAVGNNAPESVLDILTAQATGGGGLTINGQPIGGPPPIFTGPNVGKDSSAPVLFGHMASGGPVSAYRPYMVGENGPEMFVPGTSGSIVPNGGMSIGNVTFVVNGASDPAAFARQARDELLRLSRSTTNVGLS